VGVEEDGYLHVLIPRTYVYCKKRTSFSSPHLNIWRFSKRRIYESTHPLMQCSVEGVPKDLKTMSRIIERINNLNECQFLITGCLIVFFVPILLMYQVMPLRIWICFFLWISYHAFYTILVFLPSLKEIRCCLPLAWGVGWFGLWLITLSIFTYNQSNPREMLLIGIVIFGLSVMFLLMILKPSMFCLGKQGSVSLKKHP